MFIKYNDENNTQIEINSYEFVEYPKIVRIYSNTKLDNLSGFNIYENEEVCLYDFPEFKYIYDSTDTYTDYINENITYYTYAVVNSDNYVIGRLTCEDSDYSGVLIMSGTGKNYRFPTDETVYVDENGIYNYKVENNKIVEVSETEKKTLLEKANEEKLKQAKAAKIYELTESCENVILRGINYNNEHFSYNYSDQNNISNLVQMAKTTGMDVPYHSDGNLCKLYSPADIYNIYILQEMNITQNTTYLNQIKAYIDTLENVDEINSIVYGQELTGEYLKNLNDIMEHSQKIIEVLNAETTKATQ